MMTHLCPEGSEGASFAMFTTVSNSALLLASTLSSLFLGTFFKRNMSSLNSGFIYSKMNCILKEYGMFRKARLRGEM